MVPGGVIGPDIFRVAQSFARTFSLSFRILQFENVAGNLQTIGSTLSSKIPLEILFFIIIHGFLREG